MSLQTEQYQAMLHLNQARNDLLEAQQKETDAHQAMIATPEWQAYTATFQARIQAEHAVEALLIQLRNFSMELRKAGDVRIPGVKTWKSKATWKYATADVIAYAIEHKLHTVIQVNKGEFEKTYPVPDFVVVETEERPDIKSNLSDDIALFAPVTEETHED